MFNKIDLIRLVQESQNCSLVAAERTVDLVLDTVKKEVKTNGKVSIGGFGIFKKVAVKPRNARNPKTGDSVKVVAHNKVKFVASKSFKEFIR